MILDHCQRYFHVVLNDGFELSIMIVNLVGSGKVFYLDWQLQNGKKIFLKQLWLDLRSAPGSAKSRLAVEEEDEDEYKPQVGQSPPPSSLQIITITTITTIITNTTTITTNTTIVIIKRKKIISTSLRSILTSSAIISQGLHCLRHNESWFLTILFLQTRAVDSSYSDPLGPAPERPKTSIGGRGADHDI